MQIEFMNDHYGIKDNLMKFLAFEMTWYNCLLIMFVVMLCFRIIGFMLFRAGVSKF